MTDRVNRRDLFGRAFGPTPLRPPWTPPDGGFTDRCTACGDCISACPPGILARGRAGYPIVDFSRGACDFCGACAEACPEALFADRGASPWSVVARVGNACLSARGVTCRVCVEWCEMTAIQLRLQVGGRAQPVIAEASCTGCGACVPVCPAKAITMEETA